MSYKAQLLLSSVQFANSKKKGGGCCSSSLEKKSPERKIKFPPESFLLQNPESHGKCQAAQCLLASFSALEWRKYWSPLTLGAQILLMGNLLGPSCLLLFLHPAFLLNYLFIPFGIRLFSLWEFLKYCLGNF